MPRMNGGAKGEASARCAATAFGWPGGAAAHATPGTRVVVRAGIYGPVRLDDVAGTAEAPIEFEADGEVIIDASAGTGWAMSDAAFVVIEGFTRSAARGAGRSGRAS